MAEIVEIVAVTDGTDVIATLDDASLHFFHFTGAIPSSTLQTEIDRLADELLGEEE